ncbi:MAG: hypothetical protein QHH14_09535 [Clostridiales bacterium]|nr:hypothetical protein [Clostridiales bacterium]
MARKKHSGLFFYDRSAELILREKSLLDDALRIAEARYSVGQRIQANIFKA